LNDTCFIIVTQADQETIRVGQKLGALLSDGDVVGLVGELGSGKTWFTKGIARGLGISGNTVITSPSFALVNQYEGNHTFFHMDFYRLESLSEVISAGLEEYLYHGGVVVMEWADRWPEILPERIIEVHFGIIDELRREITLSGRHPRAQEVIAAIEKELT